MQSAPRPSRFALNPGAGIAVHRIGDADEPVIVIDGVLRDPQALVDYAATQVAFAPCGEGGYPGVRAPAPLDYVETIVRQLDPLIRRTFRLGDATLAEAECSFSIVTTPPTALLPGQRIPHVDTSYPRQFAVLHYLCRGDFGGTGFFRQIATGLEIIDEAATSRYAAACEADLADAPPPPGYLGPANGRYEAIGAFEAVFDRLLVYRSCLLHCGLIPPDMPLDADPQQGRLTANIFVNYAQSYWMPAHSKGG